MFPDSAAVAESRLPNRPVHIMRRTDALYGQAPPPSVDRSHNSAADLWLSPARLRALDRIRRNLRNDLPGRMVAKQGPVFNVCSGAEIPDSCVKAGRGREATCVLEEGDQTPKLRRAEESRHIRIYRPGLEVDPRIRAATSRTRAIVSSSSTVTTRWLRTTTLPSTRTIFTSALLTAYARCDATS